MKDINFFLGKSVKLVLRSYRLHNLLKRYDLLVLSKKAVKEKAIGKDINYQKCL